MKSKAFWKRLSTSCYSRYGEKPVSNFLINTIQALLDVDADKRPTAGDVCKLLDDFLDGYSTD